MNNKLVIEGALRPEFRTILTAEAMAFVASLNAKFAPRVSELLRAREVRQERFDAGELPNFLPETRSVRESDWQVAPIPADLRDRRVEITGPADRKIIINALNSGARVFMADFEDSLSPTWDNVIAGQVHLHDAVRRTIELVTGAGKLYRLENETAVLAVRPRGWHLRERHLSQLGRAVVAAFVDFGLFFFHNARETLARGTGPYFYLPKLESHLEARLWADVFRFAEAALGIPPGSVRATVLIETLPAAFEMDEILYELRDYVVGLNCGRWDYIFSFIKTLARRPNFVLPDRDAVTMTTHFMRSYSQLCIRTCHRRGAFAMGGMAGQIPIRNDPIANERALAKVRADKEREAVDGHDGTWVAHPALVPIAREVFDRLMPLPNQLHKLREDVVVTASDLLTIPAGAVTEAGLRNNVSVAIQYMASWLAGNGCVPINDLMEDAATAEIARAQLWHWIRHRAKLDDGRRIGIELFRELLSQELAKLLVSPPTPQMLPYPEAAVLLDTLSASREIPRFFTEAAYSQLE